MKNNIKRILAGCLAVSALLCGCREEAPAPFSGGTETSETTVSEPYIPPQTEVSAASADTAEPYAAEQEPPVPVLSEGDIEMTIVPDVVISGSDELLKLEYRYVGSAENAEYCFGCEYTLEKYENGEWHTVPFAENAAFIALGYMIGPECPTNSTDVSVSPDFYADPLTEGRYRVVKEVCGLTFYAEFEISGAQPRETETTAACVTAPPETAVETTAPEQITPPDEAYPDILLYREYDNYAWGYTQNITVYGIDGSKYEISVDDEDERVDTVSDGWYSSLAEKRAGNKLKKKLDGETLALISEFTEKLPNYEDKQLTEYGGLGMCDYGTVTLYGVYFDGKTVKRLKIASYGDSGVYCLDGNEVREFVNAMSERGVFSLDGFVLGGDGDLHQLYEADSEDGFLTLTINEITDHGYTCSLAFPYPAVYYVECDVSEYPDYCVGDTVDIDYSIMYKRYDDDYEYIVYPYTISPSSFSIEPDVCYKPVIYLYPEKPAQVSVRLDYAGELTVTYPEYGGGWTVTALPDGTLIDENGKTYPYLFWEGKSEVEYDFSEGFCVKGSEVGAFLREKLEYMGLIPAEYEEFIAFWEPRMRGNEYNVVSFQSSRYTDSAVLSVTPEPDTVLRVFMAYRPSDEPVRIAEQKLERTERAGFTVVEWGGAMQ